MYKTLQFLVQPGLSVPALSLLHYLLGVGAKHQELGSAHVHERLLTRLGPMAAHHLPAQLEPLQVQTATAYSVFPTPNMAEKSLADIG